MAEVLCVCHLTSASSKTGGLDLCGFVGQNDFNGHLPSEIVQASVALHVSYNPSLSGTLPNNPGGQKWPINYIGTLLDASGTIGSENLTTLNRRRTKECSRNITNAATSLAINCGGKQMSYSDPLPTLFFEDSTDFGGAGFHANTTGHWVVSHGGADPFRKSPGIVNISQDNLGKNISELYTTARTSTSDLWY